MIKRYDGKLGHVEDGNYVSYKDYAALQQKLDALGHECWKMLGLLNDICRYHEECTHDDMMHALIPLEYVSAINNFVDRDVDGENPFAATDAYLNSVRAEGVEMFALCMAEEAIKDEDEHHDKSTASNLASSYAEAMRSATHETADKAD